MTASEGPDFFRALELRLMDPAIRGSREAVSALLAEDFVEIASDGNIFDRPVMLDLLATEAAAGAAPDREISDFLVRMIAPGIALATYRSAARGRQSMRSSLWKQADGQWRMIFHQGTLL